MDTGEEQEIQAPAAAASGGGKGKLIIIGVAAVVLLAGIGAGVFMMMGKGGGSSDDGHGGDATDQLAQNAEEGGGHGEAPKDDGHGKAKKEKSGGHGGGHGGGGEEEVEVDLTVALDSVVVNLRDSRKGFVKVGFWAEAANAEAKAKIESSQFQIKDALIMMLSGKTRADLQSEEGQLLLKKQVKKKLDELIGPGNVLQIGFAEMIFT